MANITIQADFDQAKAILRDAIFKETAVPTDKETVAVLKLIKAREENIDFELGLAERICGDNECFPYRSSYYLTKFFQDLGYSFKHDTSTRRFWVRDMLLRLDTSEISSLIRQGLFKKADFNNPKLRTETTIDLSNEEFISRAIEDFRKFIDESLIANESVDLTEVLDLNVNIELLFEKQVSTEDEDLNRLISEAKERYLKPNDQVVAIEKLWDAFERIKTYYGEDKKKSAQKLVERMSLEIDRNLLEEEFSLLTRIGNEYRIRHHEIDKKPLSDTKQIKYLFFRMLALIDLALFSIQKD